MEKIEIYTEYIKLDQSLKLAGIVDQGSDAKMLIADGCVCVNGEICTMRGKKLRPGDSVALQDGPVFTVVDQYDPE